MAIKRNSKSKKSAGKRGGKKKSSATTRAPMPREPIASRVLQAAILALAALLLFSTISSPKVATILVGLLILITAFPPIRGPVDVWLTGKRRGKDAEQAAAVRMALGAATILTTIMGMFTRG